MQPMQVFAATKWNGLVCVATNAKLAVTKRLLVPCVYRLVNCPNVAISVYITRSAVREDELPLS
jgi:hypothetical protein